MTILQEISICLFQNTCEKLEPSTLKGVKLLYFLICYHFGTTGKHQELVDENDKGSRLLVGIIYGHLLSPSVKYIPHTISHHLQLTSLPSNGLHLNPRMLIYVMAQIRLSTELG